MLVKQRTPNSTQLVWQKVLIVFPLKLIESYVEVLHGGCYISAIKTFSLWESAHQVCVAILYFKWLILFFDSFQINGKHVPDVAARFEFLSAYALAQLAVSISYYWPFFHLIHKVQNKIINTFPNMNNSVQTVDHQYEYVFLSKFSRGEWFTLCQ